MPVDPLLNSPNEAWKALILRISRSRRHRMNASFSGDMSFDP